MKRIIITIITAITIITLTACKSNTTTIATEQINTTPTTQINESIATNNTYTETAEVVGVHGSILTFQTSDGNQWDWELEDGERYEFGETYTIIFDSLGDNNLYNDEIITIK